MKSLLFMVPFTMMAFVAQGQTYEQLSGQTPTNLPSRIPDGPGETTTPALPSIGPSTVLQPNPWDVPTQQGSQPQVPVNNGLPGIGPTPPLQPLPWQKPD